jgi:adenine-specific DNA-methyltransferase
MGRSTAMRENPFRFFLNRSRATATNGFLCLYPKPRLADALDGHPEREIELLQILNRIAPDTLKRNGRSYGGGLHKVEPSELLNLPLPELPPWLIVASPEPQLALLD